MFRAVAVILQGSVLAQLIGFALLPVMSRAFAPEAFGNFQAFVSILSVLLSFVCLRYEIAVLRTVSDREEESVIAICVLALVLTVAGTAIVLAVMRTMGWPSFVAKMAFPPWLVLLAMATGGVVQLLGYIATKRQAYGTLAKSKIAQALSNAAAIGVFVLVAPVGVGIILADIAGRIGNLTYFLALGVKPTLRPTIGHSDILRVAREHRDLPLISTPSTVFNAISGAMTPILIYGTFSAGLSGQFSLVDRSAGLPVALIVAAVSQVHMGYLATDMRSGSGAARSNFRRMAILLLGIAILPTLACVMFAEDLYRFVFGPGWSQAARFVQLMAPAYLLALVSGGINMTLTVMGRQTTQLVWDLGRVAAMSALWLLAPRLGWPIEWIVAAHSAILCAFSILLLILSYAALPRAAARTEIAIASGAAE